MDTKTIANLINVSLCLVALFVAVRSFDIYAQYRYLRLFILGLSMALVSLAASASFIASYVTVITLHVDWFVYIGQAVGFLFIFLSLILVSENHLRDLMNANILIFPFLVALLILSAILPAIPNTVVEILFEIPRFIICLMIFFAYFSIFTRKPTPFNLLMGLSFFLLGFGYFMILIQNLVTNATQHFLVNAGNVTGIIGLIALVAAVSWNWSVDV